MSDEPWMFFAYTATDHKELKFMMIPIDLLSD